MTQRDPLRLIGTTIDEKYLVEAMVGEGGFAVVYRATHRIWNKPVAIKLFNGLSSAPPDQREQLKDAFVQEGALLTELSSHTASIVQARDIGTFTTPEGQWMPYMVLEWLDGEPLEDILERERAQAKAPWTLAEVVGFLSKVSEGLEIAHQRGIAHRDIKPANLFVLGDSSVGRRELKVKVLDFGVAKMMSDNTQLKAALAKTGTSVTSFTPQYGAPEQFNRSYGATGPWTDVFALALVGVEMLTGRAALDGDDLVQLAVASSNPQARPTPRGMGALVPDSVEAVFKKALSTAPTERYATVGDFSAALQQSLEGIGGETLLQPPEAIAALSVGSATAGQGSRGNPPTPTTATASAPAPKGRQSSALWLGLAAVVVAGGAMVVFGRGDPTPPLAESSASMQATMPPPSSSASAAPPAPGCPEGMVEIPKGQFFMGSDGEQARDNEKPVHNVTLDAFCIDLHEVTAGKYTACSDVGKCQRARPEVTWPGIKAKDKKVYAPLCTTGDEKLKDHPVNCVTWGMADTYCKAQDHRLPTEAEWEYATRGPDGRIYPWGDEEPTAQHLNACGNECMEWAKQQGVEHQFTGALYDADDGYATTAPVGKFPAGKSRFGPYDVVGNVWEWVGDWEAPYTTEARTNPTGPNEGEKRVIRGGAWNGSFAAWLRPSFRFAQNPEAKSHGVGFRCARSL